MLNRGQTFLRLHAIATMWCQIVTFFESNKRHTKTCEACSNRIVLFEMVWQVMVKWFKMTILPKLKYELRTTALGCSWKMAPAWVSAADWGRVCPKRLKFKKKIKDPYCFHKGLYRLDSYEKIHGFPAWTGRFHFFEFQVQGSTLKMFLYQVPARQNFALPIQVTTSLPLPDYYPETKRLPSINNPLKMDGWLQYDPASYWGFRPIFMCFGCYSFREG